MNEQHNHEHHEHKEAPKKLYRSCWNRWIAGVAGGLGEYFGIDPVLVRVIFVLLALLHGAGLLLYLILALVIPCGPIESSKREQHEQMNQPEPPAEINPSSEHWLSNRRGIIGLTLIVIGILVLMSMYYPMMWWWFRWSYMWPALLILFGLWLLITPSRKK